MNKLSIFLLTFLLASCTSEVARYKLGDPYEIDGKLYIPREEPNYDETGIASWYGDEFAGRLTANGEVFNPDALTAAHQTLPMPSYVQVTNLENDKSLILRINDRGPYVTGRILDVSEAAAKKLGFHQQGKAQVRIQFLPDESLRAAREAQVYIKNQRGDDVTAKNFIPQISGGGKFYVQAAAFSSRERASIFLEHLYNHDITAGSPLIVRVPIGDMDRFRVRFGPFISYKDAQNYQETLQLNGLRDAHIVIR